MLRAALYARVSTPGQATDDRVSLPMQQAEFLRFCARHDYEPLPRIYTDVMSGARHDRPDYNQLLEDARAGQLDRIVAYDVTRFGRDAEAAILDLLVLKRDTGVTIEFMRGRHRTFADVVGDFEQGQAERERITTRVQDAMVKVRQQGRILGQAPWGYRKAGGALHVDEEQAAYVRELFRRYADGEGSPSIVRDFTARGIRTPRGALWSAPNLLRVLRNRTYTGFSDWRGRDEDGEAVCGVLECPAIISLDEFEDVQAILERRRGQFSPRSVGSGYLLGGIVFCGGCGGRMTGFWPRTRQQARKYRCFNKKPSACRPIWTVDAADLEHAVLSAMGQQMSDLRQIEDRAIGLATESEKRLDAARKRLEAAQRRMDRAVDLFFEDENLPEWERQRKRLAEAIREAQVELDQSEFAHRQNLARAAQAEAASERALSLVDEIGEIPVPAAKVKIQSIIERVDVYDRGLRAELTLRY